MNRFETPLALSCFVGCVRATAYSVPPRRWRGIKKLFGFIDRLFGIEQADAAISHNQPSLKVNIVDLGGIDINLNKLQLLFDSGVITKKI